METAVNVDFARAFIIDAQARIEWLKHNPLPEAIEYCNFLRKCVAEIERYLSDNNAALLR